MKDRRTFHGQWNARRGWWDLYCRRCYTTEELPQGNFPENVARVHAQWFHRSAPTIPVNWGNPR